jgi:hypothetical protein
LGVGLTTLPNKKKIVKKPPRNSARFCGGGQGLSWAVEPREEEEEEEELVVSNTGIIIEVIVARDSRKRNLNDKVKPFLSYSVSVERFPLILLSLFDRSVNLLNRV